MGGCVPAHAQEAETFITALSQSAWITVILPLTLLPQIQMAWRRFLLAVSIPNENSAPSITSTTIISNSPGLSGSHLIADYRLQHSAFSCLLLISVTWIWPQA